MRPKIGITLDHEPGGGYSKYPWYALRENYASSIVEAGGIALPLPHDETSIDAYLSMIDGLVITGGGFDISPSLYGDTTQHASVTLKDSRTHFEWAIVVKALERNMPVLGICGGEQLLNVVMGGTLVQHIPDEFPDSLPHEQPNPRHEASHEVHIKEGTLLHKCVGQPVLSVNSAHHQAVKTPGKGLIVSAYASDGVVEAIESPEYKFCLGVQWHPEFSISQGDRQIFIELIKACQA